MARQMVQKVLRRTLRDIMREKSFQMITVEDICNEAGISRRSFYRYFQDKYELLSHLYYEEYFSKLEMHKGWGVWDYHPELCRQCYEDRNFFRNAFKVEGQNSLRSYARDLLAPLIRADYKDSGLEENVMEFFITNTTNMLFDYMQMWLETEPCMPPEEFSRYVRSNVMAYAKRAHEITKKSIEQEQS